LTSIAVIGTGYWGINHVRTLAFLRDEGLFEEIVICDQDEERARQVAEEFGCAFALDVESLISDFSISAATIATPTGSHAELSTKLMENGIHVLVEKPMATNVKQAREMIETSKISGMKLFVGHVFRHHSAVRKAAEMIASGILGPIKLIESDRLSCRQPRDDNGVISSLGIHDMDICSDLLGDIEPTSISGFATESNIPGIEDKAILELNFSDNKSKSSTCAIINLSWKSRIRGKVRELRVIGHDASISIDYLDHSGLWLHNHQGDAYGKEFGGFDSAPREWVDIPDGEAALTAELRDFVLRSMDQLKGPPLNSGLVGLTGIQRVEMALIATGFENQLNH